MRTKMYPIIQLQTHKEKHMKYATNEEKTKPNQTKNSTHFKNANQNKTGKLRFTQLNRMLCLFFVSLSTR